MYDTGVSFNSKNGTKLAKLARDFDIPTTTFTTILKNKDNIISDYQDVVAKHLSQNVIKEAFKPLSGSALIYTPF